MQKDKVIVIVGPTASGKTALSIKLAKEIEGEIIVADSMQIYKEMDIGTAKVSQEEMQGIQHYVMDFVSPEERYSVADYKKDAKKAIKKILQQGKTPIIVGGTGLYVDSLIYEIEYLEIETDLTYRKELEELAKKKGLDYLYEQALKIDKQAMEKISKHDEKRIMRVLELYHQTGKTKTQIEIESRKKEVEYEYHVFALNWDRTILYERIDKRVDIMIQNGLVEEVKSIYEKYKKFPTAMQALGYKEVVEYLKEEISYEEMIEKIKQETRRYAKRQLTWFRKNKETIWLDALKSTEEQIEIINEERKRKSEPKETKEF